jgi:hypothetical protein
MVSITPPAATRCGMLSDREQTTLADVAASGITSTGDDEGFQKAPQQTTNRSCFWPQV